MSRKKSGNKKETVSKLRKKIDEALLMSEENEEEYQMYMRN